MVVIQDKREQRLKGQFYTERAVCDLMLALTLRSGTENLLEPGCGAGAFLVRAADCLKQHFARPDDQIARQIHGIEMDPIAYNQALAHWRSDGNPKLPQCVQGDFLSQAVENWDLFDVIIGNPPYVRHEMLKQSHDWDQSRAHAYLLEKYRDYLTQFPDQKSLFSSKTDLYIRFFLQAASLLKPGGRLAFIVSNSWLNAAFGKAFRRFLMQQFNLRFLIESACERWFPGVGVNPVIVILDKKDPENQPALLVTVLRFHQPLSAWLPDASDPTYWQKLDVQLTQLLQAGKTDSDVSIQTSPLTCFESDTFDALPWAFLMRAPQELLDVLNRSAWTTLGALGTVRYPLKTGINQFFYLDRNSAEQWGIDPRFLYPVVKSLRQIRTYRISPGDCETRLFSCQDSEQVLQEQGYLKVLRYIQWGAQQMAPSRQKRGTAVPWPLVSSVRNRALWYALSPLAPSQILCSRFVDRRFCFPLCEGEVIEDQTFYGLTLFEEENKLLVAALLNSTLIGCILEFRGRSNLGEGVLQFSREDMANLPLPDPELYTLEERQRIIDCFEVMSRRNVYPIADEVRLPDRQALDEAVLAPLLKLVGYTGSTDQFRRAMIESWLNRMQERTMMAKRKKAPCDAC